MSARWSLWAAALLLGYCHACRKRVPDRELADHLRVLHPDDAPERWPDGGPVIYDETLEPEDFATDRRSGA